MHIRYRTKSLVMDLLMVSMIAGMAFMSWGHIKDFVTNVNCKWNISITKKSINEVEIKNNNNFPITINYAFGDSKSQTIAPRENIALTLDPNMPDKKKFLNIFALNREIAMVRFPFSMMNEKSFMRWVEYYIPYIVHTLSIIIGLVFTIFCYFIVDTGATLPNIIRSLFVGFVMAIGWPLWFTMTAFCEFARIIDEKFTEWSKKK